MLGHVWETIRHGIEWFALHGDGYQFWSGIGSGSPILLGVYLFYRKHNCHVHRCPRLIWHEHPLHGHPVCRRHHPDNDHPSLH